MAIIEDMDKVNEVKRKKIFETNKKYDSGTKYEYFLDFKISNSHEIIPFIPAKELFKYSLEKGNKIYPLSGKSKTLTILCNELGFWSTYESDRYGFNNNDNLWEKKRYLLSFQTERSLQSVRL